MNRLAGHALQRGGGPHHEDGAPVDRWEGRGVYHGVAGFSTDGPGRALCKCGALSEPLPSRRERRQWHAQHKASAVTTTTTTDRTNR